MTKTNLLQGALSTLIVIFITVLLIDGLAVVALKNPSMIPARLLETFRSYYRQQDMRVLQLLPECAQYDEDLSYRLKPGACQHENREFSNHIEVNSLGVRDDESSLVAPEIIVLGDSYTMGWGVEREESFPHLLERQTGLKVLSTGVPSYGTLRELQMLTRIQKQQDMSQLKYVLIQYCHNDFVENHSLGEDRQIRDLHSYTQLSEDHSQSLAYYPGRHTLGLVKVLTQRIQAKLTAARDQDANKNVSGIPTEPQSKDALEAQTFLSILKKFEDQLKGVKVIVFETNGHAMNDNGFISEIEAQLSKNSDLDLDLQVARFGDKLSQHEHFYILDEHILPSGHEAIAKSLAAMIQIQER